MDRIDPEKPAPEGEEGRVIAYFGTVLVWVLIFGSLVAQIEGINREE